jgi:hypothetical protein
MSDLMRNAGYDAFGYRGTHRQSIETATQYYACYGKNVEFKKTVTAENARACPDYQQYVGQIVNDLETDIVMGAYRFPGNSVMSLICRREAAQPPPKRMVTVEESTCLVSSGLFAASWNNSFECTGRSHSDEGLRCVFCSAAVWKTATLRSAAAWRRFMV